MNKLTNLNVLAVAGGRRALTELKEATNICTIYGIVKRVRSRDIGGDVSYTLIGNFEAVRSSDAELFGSSLCTLNQDETAAILELLESSEVKEVQFAFDISVVPSDSSLGYDYVYDTIVEPAVVDVMAALRAEAISVDDSIEVEEEELAEAV